MKLAKDFLNKLSLAEVLTVLFFISVGISLLYKIGFYNTLGIDWYINNLDPQQLFISSIGLIGSSFIGATLGYFIGTRLPETKIYIFLFIIISIVMMVQFLAQYFHFNFDLLSKLYLITLNVLLVMIMINDKVVKDFRENTKLINIPDIKEGKLERLFRYFMPVMFVFSLTGMPYAIGVDAANAILANKKKLNQVVLKDKSTNWNLIETNGDKVLIMKNQKEKIFKIVEYKDIEYYTVN